MYIPAAETLEAARVVHSFLEWSSIGFFAGLVACDVVIHLLDDGKGFRIPGWRSRRLKVPKTNFDFTWLPPSKSGSLAGLLKMQALIWFAIAVVLEAAALPYSARIDELADKDLADAQKQTTAALTKAGGANREAGRANERAGTAIERAAKLNLRAVALESDAEAARKETEGLRSYNFKLRASVTPRHIIMGDRDGDAATRQVRFSEVRRYAGMSAIIQSVPDIEANALARDIQEALRICGWNASIQDEAQTHIPATSIDSGVRISTIETIPYAVRPAGPIAVYRESGYLGPTSRAGNAAKALVSLLTLDLGPPVRPELFGVRWEAEIEGPGMVPISKRYPFKYPSAPVLVFVGMMPVEQVPYPPAPATRSKK